MSEEMKRDEYGDPIGGPKISKKQMKKNLMNKLLYGNSHLVQLALTEASKTSKLSVVKCLLRRLYKPLSALIKLHLPLN